MAGNKLADFKEMSATGLQHAVQQHTTMDLDINLSAPYILIPHGGFYTRYLSLDSHQKQNKYNNLSLQF